jgi:mono/diheme cytochrome c family protein
MRLPELVMIVAALAAGISLSHAASTPGYTADQAQRGERLYMDNCASCHGDKLDNGDGDGAPALVGPAFTQQWSGKSMGEFFSYTATNMPANAPASLPPTAYADIVAYILGKNGTAAGADALPSDSASLNAMAMPH